MDNEMTSSEGNSYTTEFRMLDVRIGRWLSCDPIVHHHQSPYSTFNNNPQYYIDPSGTKGIASREDLGQDANSQLKSEYESITQGSGISSLADNLSNEANNQITTNSAQTELKDNLLIILLSQEELDAKYNGGTNTTMGNTRVIYATDITSANEQAQKYYGDKQPKSLAIFMHGLRYVYTDGTDAGTRALITSPETDGKINSDHINNYCGDTEIKNGESIQKDIEALEGLVNLVEDGGAVGILSCTTGDDKDLVEGIYSLSNSGDVNIYFNQDYTTALLVNGKVQIWTGGSHISKIMQDDGSLIRGIDEGWVLVNRDGIENLIDDEANTGSIFLDSRNNNDLINTQKNN